MRSAYLKKHPSAKHWISFSDFAFFHIDVSSIYYVGGFGVMGWVEPRDYATAERDPLAGVSAGIIEHMNRDHEPALRDIVRFFGGIAAEEANMVSCDRLGFVVRVMTPEGMKGRRIAFPEEARSSDDARRMLVAMTKKARNS